MSDKPYVIFVEPPPLTRAQRAKLIVDALTAPAAEPVEGPPIHSEVSEWRGITFIDRKVRPKR